MSATTSATASASTSAAPSTSSASASLSSSTSISTSAPTLSVSAAAPLRASTAFAAMSPAENALSWAEVKEICGQMETLFRTDAQKDAQRLRALLHKRKEAQAAGLKQQQERQQQLQHLLQNVAQWEAQTAAAQTRSVELAAQLQELEALKREMVAQLERLRVGEQSSKEALDQLLDKYEATRQQVSQYDIEHQHDVPRAKHLMSLYAAITGIKWDFHADALTGVIIVPHTQRLESFALAPESDGADRAASCADVDALWAKIDLAFGDIDDDL